jgi:thiamine-phosphate pyrophosphorylase
MAKSQDREPEATAPRLYLVAAADCPPAAFSAALEAADIACVLLLAGALEADTLRAAVEGLCPLAQACDVAVLLLDRATLAAETGCDGVHLSDLKALAAARQRLGAEALIGVGSGVDRGTSRHDAISAAERGADYVAFGAFDPEPGLADADSLGWWQEIMALPCVAFGAAGPEDCASLATAGADFVAVTPDMDLAACQAALEEAAA